MLRVGRLASVLTCLVALAACSAPPRSATLDPLFSAGPGTGAYEHELPVGALPARTAAGRRPPPPPAPTPPRPEACAHQYGLIGTHSYVDPLTGLPALCSVVRCAKCGEVRHECSPPPRR